MARLLRSRLNKDGNPVGDSEFDHENRFKQNFWNYCTTSFELNERISPQTTEEGCYKYFCEKLRHINRKKQFKIPKWMKVLNNPDIEFDLSPPRYNEISSIIWKMRAKASPCPFDQISVIVFKKYVLTFEQQFCGKLSSGRGKLEVYHHNGEKDCLFLRIKMDRETI